jgi:hypothetical protein
MPARAAKSKQEERAEVVAVTDDAVAETPGLWLVPGAWLALVCADPIYYGKLVALTPSHYYLAEASWIPDTGRAHAFAADPQTCAEAEYLGEVAIERPVVAVYRVRKPGKVETR